MQNITQTIEEILARPVEERQVIHQQLVKEIREDFDAGRHKERNRKVQIASAVNRSIPFQFEKGENVWIKVKSGKKVKGVINELQYEPYKTILVKPLDNVYKESMWVSECLLEKYTEEGHSKQPSSEKFDKPLIQAETSVTVFDQLEMPL